MMTYTDQKQLSSTCWGIDEDTRAVWGAQLSNTSRIMGVFAVGYFVW